MNSILTDKIEANSFLGLVTNTQKNNVKFSGGKFLNRKSFVKVESKEVLMTLALATVIIIAGLSAGSMAQQKMAITQYAAFAAQADV